MTGQMILSAYKNLRPSQRAFVDAYVQRLERDAARNNERISNALYRPVDAETVEQSGGMLEQPLVVAAISERVNQIAADSELTVHRMVKEYMAIAFSSIGDYMDIGQDGQPYFDLTRCTPEQLSAISSIKIEEGMRGRKFEFKLHDKLGGLEKLARFMGMLEADNPHWRAQTARPVDNAALPATVTVEQAGDAYGRMING